MVTNTTIYTRQMYVSLSSDTPDVDFHNGDELYLIDTRQRIIYDEENSTWYPLPTRGGGGGGVTVTPLSVTENGTYTAPSGTAYSPVTVDVASGGSSFPKTTYIHAESWQTSDKGNAATFVATYFSGFTEPGLYMAIMSNNSEESSSKAIAALMWNAIDSDGRTAYLFDRPRSITCDSTSSTWFFLAAGTQIDIYFISKELFA